MRHSKKYLRILGLPFLKMRFSWGKVGNDGVILKPRYVYLPSISDIYSYQESAPHLTVDSRADLRPTVPALFYRNLIVAYPNNEILWEIAEDYNLGLETKLFGGLIELQADFYRSYRHNILSQRVNIPAALGIEITPLDNVGKTYSRGIDLSAKLQHQFSEDLWLILNGTLTYNKVTYKEIEEATGKPSWQRKAGREISQAMGYIAEGLFKDQAEIDNSPHQDGDVQPGDIKYRDLNGDGVIDVNDATFIGYPETPRLIYGFSAFVNWKNFEFSCSFQGSGKRTFFIDPMKVSPFYNDHAMLQAIADSHWSEDNQVDHPFWPRLSPYSISYHNPYEDWYNQDNAETRKSTYFMNECRFLRCTQLGIAYNFPRKLINRWKMKNIKISLLANNPFCITNFKLWDVELGENGFKYPIQKTYSLALQVNF
ncbi:MAG: TonB-dependent receptor [Prevotella sp.]|nr:TonB-dependent receptor [Prevotella sp.]